MGLGLSDSFRPSMSYLGLTQEFSFTAHDSRAPVIFDFAAQARAHRDAHDGMYSSLSICHAG